MNVYIFTSESFPCGMATTNRVKCYAKALLSQNINCTVVVYKRLNKKAKILNERSGVFEGIPYVYIPRSIIISDNIILSKIDAFIDLCKTLLYVFLFIKKDDVVLGYNNDIIGLTQLLISVTHLKKAKYVRELCEIPYYGVETKKANNKLKITLRKQFPQCDGFIAISELLCQFAEEHKKHSACVVKMPILVDFKKYELEDNSDNSDFPYIFHSGTLTEAKDGILGIVEAFCIACNKVNVDLHLICTGSLQKSPCYTQICDLIEKYAKKDKVIFTGYIEEDLLRKYLSEATLTIINKYPTVQNKYCFSTKLGEYLAATKPVITTDVGEANRWLKNGYDAIIVPHSDVNSLSNAIVNMLNERKKRLIIAQHGKETCYKYFDYQQQSQRFAEYFLSLS